MDGAWAEGTRLGNGPDAPAGSGGVLHVDLGALRHNYARLRQEAGDAEVAGVVKADAYGLGADRVAPALWAEGCRSFFVAQFREALRLRAILPEGAAILVLNGLAEGEEGPCARAGITPVLNSLEQVDRWRALAAREGRTLPAALQVDSGMSRLGLSPIEVDALARDPARLGGIETVLAMSHLACADEPDHPANEEQLSAFRSLAAKLPPAPRSLANSAGTFLGSRYRFDLVRPGIALYGAVPCPGAAGALRPVARLEARVVQLREVAAGAGIGYGYAARAERAMRLATVGVGYADGWSRRLGNGVAAAFREGRRLPIVGRVSMDSTILDIGDAALKPGDLVELIGPDQPLEALAALAETIPYEILTSLGQRFERRYLG